MVLFDAERIPSLTGDPAGGLRARIVDLLRASAARPEIVVTFRHLEEGWVDTPEPRRESGGRRRRRGGRSGGRGAERGASALRSGVRSPAARRGATGRRGAAAGVRAVRSPSAAQRRRRSVRAAPRAPAPGRVPPRPRGAGFRRRRSRRSRRQEAPPVPAAPPRRTRGAGRRRLRARSVGPAAGRAGRMNFELSEDQARIRDAVRDFAESEIAPRCGPVGEEGVLSPRDPAASSPRWG